MSKSRCLLSGAFLAAGVSVPLAAEASDSSGQVVINQQDGFGGFTETRSDSEGNIVLRSTLVADIDGNGTTELSVYNSDRNTTTIYLTNDRTAKMVTTTIYHNTSTTIVETLNEHGRTTETATDSDGTKTTHYDLDFEPISVTSSAGIVYTGSDLEIIEGTEYRMWEFREALVAWSASVHQEDVIRTVLRLQRP